MSRLFSSITLLGLLFSLSSQAQIPLPIGQWRTHLPYNSAKSVTIANGQVYCASKVTMFSYDMSSGSLTTYDKIDGLSDIDITTVKHNEPTNTLVIAYSNSNVDLIKDNTIINIADIKRKSIAGSKRINHIFMLDTLAYLSCDFGIVVLDIKKEEIKDTYIIGEDGQNVPVNSFTADSLNFYAATNEGVKVASRNSPNLLNYQEWKLHGQTEGLRPGSAGGAVAIGSIVFVMIEDTIYRSNDNNWLHFYSDSAWDIVSINGSAESLIIGEVSPSGSGRIVLLDSSWDTTFIESQIFQRPKDLILQDSTIWVADEFRGLIKIEGKDVFDPIHPNGPLSSSVQNISIDRNQVWVATGGATTHLDPTYNADGFLAFLDNYWYTYNFWSDPVLTGLLSCYNVLVHPTQPKVYITTFWGGVVEYNNGKYTLFNDENSTLEVGAGDPNAIKVTGLTIDNESNVWFTNFNAVNNPISALLADGTWMSFGPPTRIQQNAVSQIIVDDFNQKWIIVPARSSSKGILIFDHGETIENKNDGDRYKLIQAEGTSGLHSDDIVCLAKDKDGEIWVGTAEGIAVFYCPSAIFDPGCEAQRILVTEDGFTGYLLENERINTIAVDGGNRKWIGTTNGVWLLSPDGTKEIAFFDVDNSPLLANNITDIAINGETGEVFIGTDRGIISYRGEATEGEEFHSDVLVFPNPVRHDYNGLIAVKGLAANANVKITDVNGNLFYETTAFGGQAVWDGTNPDGVRAKTGVYLVFTSSVDGSSSHVTKLLFVN